MAQEPLEIGNADAPAVGVETQVTLGNQGPYLIKSIYVPFGTGADVATRTVDFTFTLPSGVIFYKTGNTTSLASTATEGVYIVAPAAAESDIGDSRYCPLPDKGLHVPSGTVIDTITGSIQTTDQFGVISVIGYKRVLEIV